MHQFLERSVPRVLSWRDSETLAAWLGCGADELRHATVLALRPAPSPGRTTRRRSRDGVRGRRRRRCAERETCGRDRALVSARGDAAPQGRRGRRAQYRPRSRRARFNGFGLGTAQAAVPVGGIGVAWGLRVTGHGYEHR